MRKRFFIHPDITKRFFALLFISFFLSFKIFIVLLLFVCALYFLFRKPLIEEGALRSSDESILLAPISGRVKVSSVGGGISRLTIKMAYFKGFGVSMPFEGEVISFIETNENITLFNFLPMKKSKIIIVLKSKLFGEVKFIIMRTGFIFKPSVWVRSGDKGLVGAYIGCLPFAGKVMIEMKSTVNILVKENDRVSAISTLLASNRMSND